MSTGKISEGLYRTNSSVTGRNSKRGPEELDTNSVVQAVEQDDPSHDGGDRTRRTLKVCKREPRLFLSVSVSLTQFLEVQNRHIQLIGIGGKSRARLSITIELLKPLFIQLLGTIGTALFVQIGSSLTKGGPGTTIMHASPTSDIHTYAISFSASLFIAFTIWCTFILAVNNCLSKFSCNNGCLFTHNARFIQRRWSPGFLSHHLSSVASSTMFLFRNLKKIYFRCAMQADSWIQP